MEKVKIILSIKARDTFYSPNCELISVLHVFQTYHFGFQNGHLTDQAIIELEDETKNGCAANKHIIGAIL